MARGRVSPDRAWLYNRGTAQLVVDTLSNPVVVAEVSEICNFDDIESDEALIGREKSEFVMLRLMLWYRWFYTPADQTDQGQRHGIPFNVRVGQLGVDVDVTAVEQWSATSASMYARIYQEAAHWGYARRLAAWDTNGIERVNTTGTITERAYQTPPEVHFMDLSMKSRLHERHGLVLVVGGDSSDLVDGDIFSVRWNAKLLLQRGQR